MIQVSLIVCWNSKAIENDGILSLKTDKCGG